jgi:hypothetical protein
MLRVLQLLYTYTIRVDLAVICVPDMLLQQQFPWILVACFWVGQGH